MATVQSAHPDDRALYAAVLGQVIRALRGRASQGTVAGCAALSTSALSRFETGQTMPDLHEARRLSHALRIDLPRLCDVVESTMRRAEAILSDLRIPGRPSLASLIDTAQIATSAAREETGTFTQRAEGRRTAAPSQRRSKTRQGS